MQKSSYFIAQLYDTYICSDFKGGKIFYCFLRTTKIQQNEVEGAMQATAEAEEENK